MSLGCIICIFYHKKARSKAIWDKGAIAYKRGLACEEDSGT